MNAQNCPESRIVWLKLPEILAPLVEGVGEVINQANSLEIQRWLLPLEGKTHHLFPNYEEVRNLRAGLTERCRLQEARLV